VGSKEYIAWMMGEGRMADVSHGQPAGSFLSRFFPLVLLPLVLTVACLMICPPARAQGLSLQDQITRSEQKLAEARAANRPADEATELNTLCGFYRQMGKTDQALTACNEALSLEQSAGNRGGQARSLDFIGRVYIDLGQEQKALDLFNQTLPIWRELNNRSGEALALNDIGRVYVDEGQNQMALDFLNQALPIWREARNRTGEASSLDNLGKAYSDMGQGPQALENYNQALPIWREVGERSGEALTLNHIGETYSDLGQKQKTLEYYNQALAIWREIGNRPGEARSLNFIGRVYSDLGQKQEALDFLNQTLPIWREVGNLNGVALALNDIGRVYSDMGQPPRALDYYNQALPIWREVQNRRGEAATLTNIGTAYSEEGQKSNALEFDYQSLAIWREVQDSRGQSLALASIGKVESDLGQKENALSNGIAALSLAKAADDPNLQGWIDSGLMIYFRDQQRSEVAILFGMDAVNSYQQIRKNISGLDEGLQAGFAQSKSATYRELAELLVQADRLGEAEQVLDLLKEQELKEVVRGAADDAAAKVEPLKLTTAQQTAQADLAAPEKAAEALTGLSLEYGILLAKQNRTPEENARLKTLEASIEQRNADVSAFFKNTLYPELAANVSTQNANALLTEEKSDVSRLQNTLADLGPRVVGIRLLLGDEHAYAIVVTAHTRERFELKATPSELRSKVLQVRDDLRSPSSDPKPHLAELYSMVVAPFANELKAIEKDPVENSGANQTNVPTLLWSLDGVLRYLPMAALYDGQHYMIEHFNNVLFTPESYGHMAAAVVPDDAPPRVLAMGLSKSYGGLPALPGVMPELEAVVHDPAVLDSHGPMEGKLLPNEKFTLAALEAELGSRKSFPVVHIASHFVEEADGGEEPYLMLGGKDVGESNGYALTLSRIEDSSISFHGTKLLTLSACSTAKGDAAKDGQEMDSLGMIAQQKDAEAVLATLWDVNDTSTSRLMSDFYARWVRHPEDGKAESLRQAQLAFLRGSPIASAKNGDDRGFQSAQEAASAVTSREAGYSHPYYWAPFVLIGNFQ
jgi:CHAT domain-containing protein